MKTKKKKHITRALTNAATKRNAHTGETSRQKEARIAKAFGIKPPKFDVRETVMSRKKFKRALDTISPEAMALAIKVDRLRAKLCGFRKNLVIQEDRIENDGAQVQTRPTLPDKFHAAGRGLPLFEKIDFAKTQATKPSAQRRKAAEK